jgi:hypothetical protein
MESGKKETGFDAAADVRSRPRHTGILDALEPRDRNDPEPARAVSTDAQGRTLAASVIRQDFLIPRARNRLFRLRAGAQPFYIEIWGTRLSPAISRSRMTGAMCHVAKGSVFSNAGSDR